MTRDTAIALSRSVGFVIIGRNEGARLDTCIASVLNHSQIVVYVDSGSSDDSVRLARRFGLPVVELDPSRPFTAARARNAGFAWMRSNHPDLTYVHFIDGDCELMDGWLPVAMATMRSYPSTAAVCGRRRERHPEASAYNRLCDSEWNTPIGLAETCGGDALFRIAPLIEVGGFSNELIAGEEPDLCFRIRMAGWQIRRIDCDMTVHDAAMTRFGQWWQRNRRSGYATAEAYARRGHANPQLRRQVVSNVVWGLPFTWIAWPILWVRVFCRRSLIEAMFITLGKVPHLQGQTDFWRKRKQLIEYK